MKVINTNKNYWKQLSASFNEYASKDDWKHKRSIKVSHTSLFPIHEVGRGPNIGEPTLLDFSTRLIDANAIYFHFESKYQSLHIYINSNTGSRGCGDTFFDVRRNNKNLTFVFRRHSNDQNWLVKEILKVAGENACISDGNDLKKELIKQGYSIVSQFEFNSEVEYRLPHHGGGKYIHPKYVKRLKNGIEIGWISSGTYNAIPQVLRVEKCRGLNTKLLRGLKIETEGYYDGHYKCEILASQAKEAKRFFTKRFERTGA